MHRPALVRDHSLLDMVMTMGNSSYICRFLLCATLLLTIAQSFQIRRSTEGSSSIRMSETRFEGEPHIEKVLFIECGM